MRLGCYGRVDERYIGFSQMFVQNVLFQYKFFYQSLLVYLYEGYFKRFVGNQVFIK